MFDQYDNPVPGDLVALTAPITSYTTDEVEQIDELDWYEVDTAYSPNTRRPVMVSRAALASIIGKDRARALPASRSRRDVFYVAAILHRHNERDGFYHA